MLRFLILIRRTIVAVLLKADLLRIWYFSHCQLLFETLVSHEDCLVKFGADLRKRHVVLFLFSYTSAAVSYKQITSIFIRAQRKLVEFTALGDDRIVPQTGTNKCLVIVNLEIL